MTQVSIILPTYNRAAFLPGALDSIRDQTFADWELIIVDDGSTDTTSTLLPTLLSCIHQPCHIIRQANKGAAEARNAGIQRAVGQYIAFFDSDDFWCPNHLAECVNVLNQHPDIDWVYSATRIVSLDTADVLDANCFFENGRPRPFLADRFRRSSQLFVLPPKHAVRIAIVDSLYCGLQTSVIRRAVFDSRMLPDFRVGEDQVFSILAALDGRTLASLNSIHVEYRKHDGNTGSSTAKSTTQNAATSKALAEALMTLLEDNRLPRTDKRALRRRLQRDLLWSVGYRLQLAGNVAAARRAYCDAMSLRPWSLQAVKRLISTFVPVRE